MNGEGVDLMINEGDDNKDKVNKVTEENNIDPETEYLKLEIVGNYKHPYMTGKNSGDYFGIGRIIEVVKERYDFYLVKVDGAFIDIMMTMPIFDMNKSKWFKVLRREKVYKGGKSLLNEVNRLRMGWMKGRI